MKLNGHDSSESIRGFPVTNDRSQVVRPEWTNSRILRRALEAYFSLNRRIWNHLPATFCGLSLGRMYGRHLHALVRFLADRKQYVATFFLRNRPELELMRRLLDEKAPSSKLDISVLACSKGAEVHSILWSIRSARPDLKLRMHAVDISQEILEFAERGIYARSSDLTALIHASAPERADVTLKTSRDQNAPIFERMTAREIEAMCDLEGDQARIKSWLREGVTWLCADACDPELVGLLGPQDIVVANRFLCHMEPAAAESCLRNVARLVKSGGYLFVSGIDLDVRTRVARSMGWRPVTDLMREIHEGDSSLRKGWPLEYWGLEPFLDSRPDREIRYASVFQIGETPRVGVVVEPRRHRWTFKLGGS